MNSDHDALLRTIVANPDDDLPRLVFADFLEESGHPANVARAHFIRLQIEAEEYPADSPKRASCLERAVELRGQFQDEVDLIVPETNAIGFTGIRRRGFLEEVHAAELQLLHYGPQLVDIAPVTSLKVNMLANHSVLSRGLSWLSAIRSFEMSRTAWPFYTDVQMWLQIIRNPHFTQLRTLNLSNNRISDAWVVQFVTELPNTAFAKTLRELILSGTEITDRGAITFASARGVDALTRLDLRDCRITSTGEKVLRRRYGDRVQL